MNVNFELYKIFYVVVNNKSISKGAEVLLISQPAVTQSIKNLENQLEVTLLVRTNKGISLTKEGEVLYKYISEGMNYFINGTNKLSELKNLEDGIIKIGASTSITEHFLMKYINKFHRLYPNIDIKIINGLTDDLIHNLRNGNVDIVIGGETFKKNNDVVFNKISDINYIFVNNRETSMNISDLIKDKIIVQSNNSVTRGVFNSFIREKNLECNPYMEVVSHRLVTEFVKNGMGIGFVIKEYILEELNNNLFEVKVNETLPKRKIGYSLLNNHLPSFAIKKIIEIISEQM